MESRFLAFLVFYFLSRVRFSRFAFLRFMLYVCASPIGNLDDVSPRLLSTLREADLVCAEDTRHSGQLLRHFEISTPLTSCHAHTPPAKITQLVAKLQDGQTLALITDAGTPGVSDPGPQLVRAALNANITVSPIAGPCALACALSVSGFDAQRFSFGGFLPRKPGKRRKALDTYLARGETLVFYEGPHRVVAFLEDLAARAPERQVVLCRELTKKFEEVVRGSAGELAKIWAERKETRGEFALVVGPESEVADEDDDE